MKYDYENLDNPVFEKLVVCICKKLFGHGVQGFAGGRDGGRDGKFTGKAECFPSSSAPWEGTVIIQAKHTYLYNKSFSENDFYGNKDSILAKELPKIKKLYDQKELDHYILFSNRKLTGDAQKTLVDAIAKECAIPQSSISLQGIDDIESHLKSFPDIIEMAGIDPVDAPLIISPDELSKIIEAFAKACEDMDFHSFPCERTSLEDKNRINGMSEEYSKDLMARHLKSFDTVKTFLALPENEEIRESFELATSEINLEIIAKRDKYNNFDKIMQYIKNTLVDRDYILRKNKRLTELLLFYMYWNCDIGRKEENI